jgi:hypothetical protein
MRVHSGSWVVGRGCGVETTNLLLQLGTVYEFGLTEVKLCECNNCYVIQRLILSVFVAPCSGMPVCSKLRVKEDTQYRIH